MTSYRTRAGQLHRFVGFRGTYLGVLSIGFFAYGMGLVLGYTPTFAIAFGHSTGFFGYMWVVGAIAVSTGIWIHRDIWHFTLAVLMMLFWAIILMTFWQGNYGWAAGISWLTLTANTALVGVWTFVRAKDQLPPAEDGRAQ